MQIYDLGKRIEDRKQTLAGLTATLHSLDSTIRRASTHVSSSILGKHLIQLETIKLNIEKDIVSLPKKSFRQPSE